MPAALIAVTADLPSLLNLFAASEVSRAAEPHEHAERVWQEMMTRPGVFVFVSDERDRIAATCMLINSTKPAARRATSRLLENVVTHPELRGRGHGRAVVGAALRQAWADECHHVLMQSGRTDPRVHVFYQGLGFVPGLRVAYAAHRPSSARE